LHIINILGFITLNFLPICVLIMAAVAIFQALIWVGVHIGKFFIDIGVRYILENNYMVCVHASVWVAGWLFCLHCCNVLSAVMD
jgi:hypothetical protein